MSLRGVWVISADRSATGRRDKTVCLFSRRYPTVERRAKFSSSYFPLPSDPELTSAVVTVCCRHISSSFVAERDSCMSGHAPPVFELMEGKLWPVVVIERGGLLLVGIPLATRLPNESGLDQPSIPCSLALLESVAQILTEAKPGEESSKLNELSQYLMIAAPFGTPLDLSPANVATRLSHSKGKPLPSEQQKQPSWRPGVYRGPPRLSVCVREEIKAMQYDKQGVADTLELAGTLLCKAEVEGSPDIQVTLTTPPDRPEVDDVLVHPIVYPDDAHHTGHQRKVRFSAPLDTTPLLHYQLPHPPVLPIRGFYQMKGDSSVRLLVQLKLNESVRNSFDYCEVHIPFFNRGVIDKLDSIVPNSLAASLALDQDSKTIIWNIGQRFPVKSLELSLQATVHFREASDDDKPFYVGSNSYIEVFFKVSDFTLSGATVDPKSITLFPSAKPRISISRELLSSCYRIWNSHGDVIATYPQLRTT